MKKAEYIVDYDLQEILDIAVMNSSYCRNILIRVVKQAQIDAIKETCKRCANEAEMTGISYGNDKSITDYEVDKNSIISVADILIKELEDGNKD